MPRDAVVVRDLLERVDRALPFTSVVTVDSPSTVWVADVTELALAGHDALAPWRLAVREQQSNRHDVDAPPHVAAAFVLQWWCEVAATPIAYAAGLGPWVLQPSPAGLGFELAPGLHPHRVIVRPEAAVVELEQDPARRTRRARAAYDGLVGDVVRDFAPDVKMSSRQRWGVVDDMWAAAVRLARGAAGETVGPEARRASCCFIVALPGMRECAACPRLGPA